MQPSFYDSIIRLKRLPYLPDIVSANSSTWNVYVEDFMIRDIKSISIVSTYAHLKDLLSNTFFRAYPLVDSSDSMILLGSIQRFELERLLMLHMSHDQKIAMPDNNNSDDNGNQSDTSQPSICITTEEPASRKPRFEVTKVKESSRSPSPVRAKFDIHTSSSSCPNSPRHGLVSYIFPTDGRI
ncbi:hypothetical protein ScPMuIL_009622 [Solemya velum]